MSKFRLKQENFFNKIDTPEKSYFLGWLYADGNMAKNLYTCTLELSEKDKDVLHYFNQIIFENKDHLYFRESNEFFDKKGKKFVRKARYTFAITNRDICEQLFYLGVVPAKSLILKFPTKEMIPNNLMPYFLRGYFEGDGWITLRSNTHTPRIGICCSDNFAIDLNKYLSDNNIISTITKSGKISNVNIQDYDSVYKFYHFVYSDLSVFFLKRKYDKLKQCYEERFLSKLNNKTSKFIGIHFKKKINRWIARATIDGIRYNVGSYKTEEDAHNNRIKFLDRKRCLC